MNDERYSIIYSSRTGNTRLLAEAIRESLPADLCDHFGTDEAGAVESEKLYVGFWTDKGTADEAALALLKRLKNKKIFLFGTAGFGESEAYFQKVLDRVKESIDESNSIIGTYRYIFIVGNCHNNIFITFIIPRNQYLGSKLTRFKLLWFFDMHGTVCFNDIVKDASLSYNGVLKIAFFFFVRIYNSGEIFVNLLRR